MSQKIKTPEQQIQEFKEEIAKRVNEHNTRKALILEQSRVIYYITELNHKLWRIEEEAQDENEENHSQNGQEAREKSSHQEVVSDSNKKK